jgi:LytR cell envelope-related transcriptional attenuator/Tetratricopeptide repeat
MSTVLVTGCAGVATNTESLRVLLERSGQSQPKLSAYDQGKRQLQLGRAGSAVAAFEDALKADPNSVPALNGIAVAYDRLGRTDVAQRYLDRALALDPESAVTLNNLAYLNLVQGNTAVAQAYADRAKIVAALPMDMMLPETIATAIDRTAQIAAQVAKSEAQERQVAQAPALPPESDIKRVGLNEWELRIRPPNPADAVRINLPARDAAPRVIEPMARAVLPSISADPLTEAVTVSDIPDSVMADLMAPPSGPMLTEAVVAPLPQAVMPVAVAPLSSQPTEPAHVTVIAATVAPPAPVSELEFRSPAIDAIAAMPPVAAFVPPQPLPEPVREEPFVAVLPEPAPLPQFGSPAAEAVAAVLPVAAFVPPQPLPEPVREEPMVAALPPSEALPEFRSPVAEAIAAMPPMITLVPTQPSLEPVLEEPVVVPAVATAIPAEQPAEAARLQQLMASLSAPAPQTVVPLPPPRELDISRPADEAPKPAQPVAPVLAAPPPAQFVAPMVASLAPSRGDALRSTSPANAKSDWRASVPPSTLVRVSNGTGRRLMASRFARHFGEHGLPVRRIANANSFNYRRTVIFYNPDQRAQAEALAAVLPFPVRLAEAKQSRGQIELILGFDLLSLDDKLRSA